LDDKTREAMLKIIEEKKRKSSSQSGFQRNPGNLGTISRRVPKQYKKGGLFDK